MREGILFAAKRYLGVLQSMQGFSGLCSTTSPHRPTQDLLILCNGLALRVAGTGEGKVVPVPWKLGNTGALGRGQGWGFPHMLTLLRIGRELVPISKLLSLLFIPHMSLLLLPRDLEQLLGGPERNTVFGIKFKMAQNFPQEIAKT